jgi:hypothetical protein
MRGETPARVAPFRGSANQAPPARRLYSPARQPFEEPEMRFSFDHNNINVLDLD